MGVKANQFWGRKFGTKHLVLGNVFKGRRGSAQGGTASSSPSGRRRTRFYQNRYRSSFTSGRKKG